MSINIMENGWVQDNFELTHAVYGVYRGAIVMPQEEYDALTPDQIANMKQQRLDDWAAYIIEMSNQPVVIEEPS